MHGQERRALCRSRRHELAQRRLPHQRHVAVEHEHLVRVGATAGRACATACPVPFCSACSAHATGSRPNASRTCSPPCPYTTCMRGGSSGARRLEHVLQQRPAGERLQDLRQVRFHAFALAGGQDHDGKRHARVGWWARCDRPRRRVDVAPVRTYSKKSSRNGERQAELVRLIFKTGSLLGGLHPRSATQSSAIR